MAISRTHFREVAAILRRADISDEARAQLAAEFTAVFRRSNPRFDKTEFYEAAGVDPSKAPGPFA